MYASIRASSSSVADLACYLAMNLSRRRGKTRTSLTKAKIIPLPFQSGHRAVQLGPETRKIEEEHRLDPLYRVDTCSSCQGCFNPRPTSLT